MDRTGISGRGKRNAVPWLGRIEKESRKKTQNDRGSMLMRNENLSRARRLRYIVHRYLVRHCPEEKVRRERRKKKKKNTVLRRDRSILTGGEGDREKTENTTHN